MTPISKKSHLRLYVRKQQKSPHLRPRACVQISLHGTASPPIRSLAGPAGAGCGSRSIPRIRQSEMGGVFFACALQGIGLPTSDSVPMTHNLPSTSDLRPLPPLPMKQYRPFTGMPARPHAHLFHPSKGNRTGIPNSSRMAMNSSCTPSVRGTPFVFRSCHISYSFSPAV